MPQRKLQSQIEETGEKRSEWKRIEREDSSIGNLNNPGRSH